MMSANTCWYARQRRRPGDGILKNNQAIADHKNGLFALRLGNEDVCLKLAEA